MNNLTPHTQSRRPAAALRSAVTASSGITCGVSNTAGLEVGPDVCETRSVTLSDLLDLLVACPFDFADTGVDPVGLLHLESVENAAMADEEEDEDEDDEADDDEDEEDDEDDEDEDDEDEEEDEDEFESDDDFEEDDDEDEDEEFEEEE